MLFTFDRQALVHPPEDVASFIDNLIKRLIEEGQYYEGPNRRTERRHVVALQVQAMPLGNDLQPAGQGFVTTTKDISRKGMAVIHFESIESPFLAVELTDPDGKKFQGAVEVLRCRSLGPYFEIAGKYVTKIYDPLETVLNGNESRKSATRYF
jgi:hypothetical protein